DPFYADHEVVLSPVKLDALIISPLRLVGELDPGTLDHTRIDDFVFTFIGVNETSKAIIAGHSCAGHKFSMSVCLIIPIANFHHSFLLLQSRNIFPAHFPLRAEPSSSPATTSSNRRAR